MKQILIILGLFASVSTFAQSPRIKLNQITKDSLTGSVLISSPSDSGMVYSRDFYISYGADTVLILYGDTLAATSGIISSVLSDGVTITGDGTSGNELKVDTSTVISTIQGLIDTLAARGYLQVTQLTDTLDANTRGFLTTEVDGSVSNEGSLTVGDGTASTSVISSNTSGSTDVTLTAGSNITLSEAGNNITIAATGGGTTYNNISETADTVFISGDLNVDANTLRVDATTNRVGIGTSTPEAKLSVVGNISLDSGNSNFVIGKNAGESLTSGSSNTAIGSNALQYTATANNNFAIGSKALQNNTIGYGNIAIGTNALRDNTEGANNFAIGTNALLFNETASSNLAIGNSALVYFNSGNLNTAIGNNAGQYLADGSQLTTASNSVYVGYFTKASANSVTNENVFGYSATGNGSNSVTLGNSSITKTILNGNVGIGTSSPSQKLSISGTSASNAGIYGSMTNLQSQGFAGLYVEADKGGSPDYAYATFQVLGSDVESIGYTGLNNASRFRTGPGINKLIMATGASKPIIFQTNDVDRMTIDGSGNVGIGTSSPQAPLSVAGSIHMLDVNQTDGTDNTFYIYNDTDAASSSGSTNAEFFMMVAKKGSTSTSHGPYFLMRGNDWSRGTDGRGLLFFGAGGGLSSPTGYDGNVGFATNGGSMYLQYNGSLKITNLAGSGTSGVSVTADGTLYRTSSINIKESVEQSSYGINEIKNLNPVTFYYKDKVKFGNSKDIGFIAEQVYDVIPEAVGITNEGNYHFDNSKLTAVTVKAIQEQQAQIETIQTELDAKSLIIETQEQTISDLQTTIQSLITRIENLENK